jgi:hypothetical protein
VSDVPRDLRYRFCFSIPSELLLQKTSVELCVEKREACFNCCCRQLLSVARWAAIRFGPIMPDPDHLHFVPQLFICCDADVPKHLFMFAIDSLMRLERMALFIPSPTFFRVIRQVSWDLKNFRCPLISVDRLTSAKSPYVDEVQQQTLDHRLLVAGIKFTTTADSSSCIL